MAVAYVSHSAAAVAGSVFGIVGTEPAGSVGDTIIAFVYRNNTTGTPTTVPAGYTQLDAESGSAVFWSTAADTGGNTKTWSMSNNVGAGVVVLVRFSGVGSVSVGEVSQGGGATSIDLESITTLAANSLISQIVGTISATAATWSPPGGTTMRSTAGATASGNAVPYAVGDDVVVAIGATGTRTWTKNQSQQSRGAIVALAPPSTIDLTVADATQSQAADSPTLTQTHSLTVAGAAHSQAADAPTLTQVHVLAVDSATQAQSAGNVALTQVHTLVVQDAAQSQAVESPTLTQSHTLAVGDAVHAQTADQVTLGASVTTDLTVDDATQDQAADSPTLTQTHTLTVADGQHVQLADDVTLTQVHDLAVDAATQAQTALSATLSQVHALAVDDALHALSSDVALVFEVIPTATAAERIAVVPAEVRTLAVAAEVRRTVVAAEDRTTVVAAETRTVTIPAEERIKEAL